MKNYARQLFVFALAAALVSLSGCSSSKKVASPAPPKEIMTPDVKSSNAAQGASTSSTISVAGTWAFEVKGTPDGDVKGDMIISTDGNTPKGMISAFGGQSEIQSLKIDQNTLTGIFYYNGMAINMSGTFNGNNYNGKVEAEGYSFPMTAAKK
jgi:hypothetical protein